MQGQDVKRIGVVARALEKPHYDAATTILDGQLRELQSDRLIERTADPSDDRAVRYHLTRKGQHAVPILAAFIQYGSRHHAQRVFEDGKPRTLRDLLPGEQKTMLGALMSYIKGATPNTHRQPSMR